MSLRFTPADGGIEAHAADRELAVLGAVPRFLSTIVEEGGDPLRRSGAPPVYEDEGSDHEFRRLATAEIDDGRSRDRDALETVLGRLHTGDTELSVEEAQAMVRALGTARLALAARSGLFDLDELPVEPHSPQEMLVAFLGVVQEELVEALSDLLPVTS